jgi:formyl-CoA transferase
MEMGRLLAGPFCGRLPADLGAAVIELERPGHGDPMRVRGRGKPHGESLRWPAVARDERRATANARTPQGRGILRDPVAGADIPIGSFRPGTMERWGPGWQDLSAIDPRLVAVRVTGFGRAGPTPSARAAAPSGRRWGGCAASWATRRRRPRAWASPSGTSRRRSTRPSAR